MKRYNEPDLEKVLSGDVLYMAIEKSGSEQLNQQNNYLFIVFRRRSLVKARPHNRYSALAVVAGSLNEQGS